MKRDIFIPGRTELAGNHTDHQKGRILAAAIDLGIHAMCEDNGTDCIMVRSRGFEDIQLRLNQLYMRAVDFGKPRALVSGVVAIFKELGLNVGGFDAIVTSTLPVGAGLSSSAAFAVLICEILNELFNDSKIDKLVIARVAQQAENQYFGKPCGLMSQLACAMGKTIYVDFKTGQIEPVKADFGAMGLTMCLTDTGGSHAGLDTSYSRIPADMSYVANLFDKGVLADVDPEEFRSRGWDLSNRPVRRAKHFFDENERVPLMRDALIAGDGKRYMELMNQSGRSSEQLLKNIITSATGDTKLSQGLKLSEKLLSGIGAWRVHGGGFAGCVQALMPSEYYSTYKREMEQVFGRGSCRQIHIK